MFVDHHSNVVSVFNPFCHVVSNLEPIHDGSFTGSHLLDLFGRPFVEPHLDAAMIVWGQFAEAKPFVLQFNFSPTDWLRAKLAAYGKSGVLSRGLAEIFEADFKMLVASERLFFFVRDLGERHIRTQLLGGGSSGDVVGVACQAQCHQDKDCSNETENGCKPRREYLFFGGISSPYLGIQIARIVLAALGFAAGTSVSLLRGFEYNYIKVRWLLLATLSGFLSLFFWGWAWAGNPFSAWGLAP